MKFIYSIGLAVLLCIVAAWWFTGSEDQTNVLPVPATSSDFDASRQMDGNIETQQQGSRQQATRSNESTAGRDGGSGSAMAAPAGNLTPSASGTEQVALRNATQTLPGQLADSKSSQPSEVDKTACDAAARTLGESWRIYDLTPTLAIAYGGNRPASPYAAPSGFSMLKQRLLAPLCSGSSAFTQDYQAQMEFVAISTDSHVRILMGDHWISDGTVLTNLSEQDQGFFANFLQVRRRGAGPNMSREEFERTLAKNPNGWPSEP
jgi:hypothetical protein